MLKPEHNGFGFDVTESETQSRAKISAVTLSPLNLLGEQRAKGFWRGIALSGAAFLTHWRNATLHIVLANQFCMPLAGRQLAAAEGTAPSELLTQRFPFSFCKIHVIP